MKRNSILLFTTIFLVFISSCRVKPVGGSGKINKYVESFYKKDGMLYFIKPVEFYENGNKVLADFTFIKNDSIAKPVITNLNIYGTPPFKQPDSVAFSYADKIATSKAIKLLYNDISSKKKFSRISTELPYSHFESFLLNEKSSITLYYGNQPKQYIAGKTWRKTHTKIHQIIFW
jgi:hypothetical protein